MALKAKDIAAMLGLSPATVSLVLNGKPGISEATRQKVFSLVKELGHPELLPQEQGGVKSIGFIIYKNREVIVSETPFFSQLMEGIELRCRAYGYKLMISYIYEETTTQDTLKEITQGGCEGVILLATEMRTASLKPFSDLQLPLVVLDSYFEREKYDSVVINNTHGAYEATDYLVKCGHKKIGYLRSSYSIKNFQARYEGFSKALTDNRIPQNPAYLVELGSSMETSYEAMRRHLEHGLSLPTAFFAENDLIALGAIKALKEKGIRTPEDISVIGFDNTPLSQMTEPGLTTIHVPKQRMGILAVDRLVARINDNPEEFVKLEVGTRLVVRDSVKPIEESLF